MKHGFWFTAPSLAFLVAEALPESGGSLPLACCSVQFLQVLDRGHLDWGAIGLLGFVDVQATIHVDLACVLHCVHFSQGWLVSCFSAL